MDKLYLAAGFWLNASDKQPDQPGYYLTVCGAAYPMILYWTGKGWQYVGPKLVKVSHWAHLSDPNGNDWR